MAACSRASISSEKLASLLMTSSACCSSRLVPSMKYCGSTWMKERKMACCSDTCSMDWSALMTLTEACSTSLPARYSRPTSLAQLTKSSTFGISSSPTKKTPVAAMRSEEHTSELQSRLHLVCRLLLEKKK